MQQPRPDLPDGWREERRSRANGSRKDSYFYPPGPLVRPLRSLKAVHQHLKQQAPPPAEAVLPLTTKTISLPLPPAANQKACDFLEQQLENQRGYCPGALANNAEGTCFTFTKPAGFLQVGELITQVRR